MRRSMFPTSTTTTTMTTMTMSMAMAIALSIGASLSLTACRLTTDTEVGKKCDNSAECQSNDLSCVPTDFDSPGGSKVCMPPPEDWTCQGDFLGDGKTCDCGCGFLDFDCNGNASSAACSDGGNNCPGNEQPDPADNTKCI